MWIQEAKLLEVERRELIDSRVGPNVACAGSELMNG